MKLTKRQRAKLVTAEDRDWLDEMGFERMLAVHDLIHDLMLERTGTAVRKDAEVAYTGPHEAVATQPQPTLGQG